MGNRRRVLQETQTGIKTMLNVVVGSVRRRDGSQRMLIESTSRGMQTLTGLLRQQYVERQQRNQTGWMVPVFYISMLLIIVCSIMAVILVLAGVL